MTYQGERARPIEDESGRSFEVSKIRLGADGRISEVLWSEVSDDVELGLGAQVVAPVAEVVDALHDGARVAAVFGRSTPAASGRRPERRFVVALRADGGEGIALAEPASPGRELGDLIGIDD